MFATTSFKSAIFILAVTQVWCKNYDFLNSELPIETDDKQTLDISF